MHPYEVFYINDMVRKNWSELFKNTFMYLEFPEKNKICYAISWSYWMSANGKTRLSLMSKGPKKENKKTSEQVIYVRKIVS